MREECCCLAWEADVPSDDQKDHWHEREKRHLVVGLMTPAKGVLVQPLPAILPIAINTQLWSLPGNRNNTTVIRLINYIIGLRKCYWIKIVTSVNLKASSNLSKQKTSSHSSLLEGSWFKDKASMPNFIRSKFLCVMLLLLWQLI